MQLTIEKTPNKLSKKIKDKSFISLFSGIGGFDKPLHTLGYECVLASEIDENANKSFELLYDMKTVGDITKIKEEDVPNHDLLVGGFPCQAFSIAGKRLGFEDVRGTLFFEVARIAKEKQPKFLLLENVKGLLSHDGGRTVEVICQTLNEIGYYVDINVMNSKYFIPQLRERVYFACIRKDLVEPEKWELPKKKQVIHQRKEQLQEAGVIGFNFQWKEQTELAPHVNTFLEENVDMQHYVKKYIIEEYVDNLPEDKFLFGQNTLNPSQSGHSKCLTTRTNSCYTYNATMIKHRAIVISHRLRADEISHLPKDFVEEKSVQLSDGSYLFMRRLSPRECFLLQGFTHEDFEKLEGKISNTELYKQAGNAVTIPVVQSLIESFENQFKELFEDVDGEELNESIL